MKRVLVNGTGGFIGGHLVKRLKNEGFWIRAVDIKQHEFSQSPADEFILGDLQEPFFVRDVVAGIDEVYQLAADMGGAGYIFTGEHDAQVMHNSATINLNTLEYGIRAGVKRFFYSSSAIHIKKRTRLFAVAPDLDYSAVWRLRYFAAKRSRRLFTATPPRALGAEDIVEPRDADRHSMIAVIRKVQPLTEELLPAVLAVGRGRIGGLFCAVRVLRVALVVLRVDTGSALKEFAGSWTLISGDR